MMDEQPAFVVFHFSDGTQKKLDWKQWQEWQRQQADEMMAEQMERLLKALDGHAAGQLELMRRDLGDEQPTEH
jgi:hypothetical protein